MTTMLRPGETIAGYRVDDILGGGGMGIVYRATQLSLGRPVALKVLAPHLSSDPDFRLRFRREAALQARLEHAHILTVYEAGESEDGLFLALRLVEGTDLRRLIDAGTLAPSRALMLLAQVASALDAAHEAGLVHRDVKPQNVLVDTRDHAYLADFGLTKSSGARGLTETGAYVGSLDYAAPELVRGESFTPAADVYAFAAVLFESLVGEVPFPRETEAALLFAHLSEPPPQPSAARPGLPHALDAVVARGLAKEPVERYTSAGELVRDAENAFAGVDSQGSDTRPRARFSQTVVDPALRRRAPIVAVEEERRLPALPLLIAGLALCVALAVAGFLLGHSRTRIAHPALAPAVAGRFSLRFPIGRWHLAPRPLRIHGLALDDPVTLTGEGATLLAGVAPATDARTLLPTGFRQHAPARRVLLGPHHALRYQSRQSTVYAVPVGRGSAIVVCRGNASALGKCESVAATLTLLDVREGTIGPNRRYATALHGVLRRFGRVRRAERAALVSANTPGERAGHAEVLASALASTEAQVATLVPGPRERPSQHRLAAALAHARDAYVDLAAALRAGDRGGYVAAERRVARAEADANGALRSLRALGYRFAR